MITVRQHILKPIRNNWPELVRPENAVGLLEAGAVFYFAQHLGLLVGALAVVLAVELWPLRPGGPAASSRAAAWQESVPAVLMGAAVAVVIAVTPRLATQAAVAIAYAAWHVWWGQKKGGGKTGLGNLLLLQAVMSWAVFLAAGTPGWRHNMHDWLVVGLVWLGAYLSVYSTLARRGERTAAVLAATWALVAAEVAWVLNLWLYMYTVPGGYLIVPQAALVLTALAYCFGSIYVSQREGTLSRGRLTEYLLIGLILIAIVITGTSWRGTL